MDSNVVKIGLNGASRVDITGTLFINGVDNSAPDYIFEPDYPLESIEEHAESMWKNKHLPALPTAASTAKEGVDVVRYQFGVLEELEKAHIYIAQLSETLAELSAEVADLKQQR